MPTIAGRQRPVEKLAAAVAKCGAEVRLTRQHQPSLAQQR